MMARAMSPGAVARLREEFQREAEALIDRVLARGQIEGVTEIAEAYSGSVFPRAVGLRNIDVRKLVDYGAMVFNAVGPDNQLRRAAMAKGPRIALDHGAVRAEEPGTDRIGSDIYAAADSGDLSPQEAAMLVRSLLQRRRYTVTGIGSALWTLATNPEQFAKLKADPSLARNAFDETLRLTSPVHTFCRTAGLDTEVAGITIRQGAKILCVLGAANLDAAQWSEPDRFDITRRASGHLAFGIGIHGCVGQNIARAEGEAILRALAQRVTRLELDGPAVWRPNNAMHALDRLPLKLS